MQLDLELPEVELAGADRIVDLELAQLPRGTELDPDAAVAKAEKLVANLSAVVTPANFGTGGNSARVKGWTSELGTLRDRLASSSSITIAVCGGTGVGKSSLLNQLISPGTECLLAVSCMRACTAAIVEISYVVLSSLRSSRHSYHDEDHREAEIVMLTEDEWRAELGVLLSDLIDENGVVQRTDGDSEAGVAWSKLHAVYVRSRAINRR